MFSPIRAAEVDVPSCYAHLIPEALGVSNTQVVSEREFDNQFGRLNDNRLVKYIRNCTEEEKEVTVSFIDPKTKQTLHRSSIRAKSTLVGDRHGVRNGNIDLDHLAAELKSRIGLGIGSLMMLRPYSPTREDCCRIGLSMLHSAYLTMYYHFGTDYVGNENVDPIRTVLLNSVNETLSEEAGLAGLWQYLVTPRFIQTFQPHNITYLASELRSLNRHAVTIWSWQEFSCFGVWLPYHQKCTAICLLPGFGEEGAQGFRSIMSLICVSNAPIPVRGTRLVPWRPSSKQSAEEFWRKVVIERTLGGM